MCRSSSQILQKIRQLKLAPLTLNQERKSSMKAVPLAVLNRTIKWAPSLVTPRVLNLLVLIHIKDIVQPKKRGVKRGTIRYVLTSYTIADIF
jgi:hypothetical protein